MDYWIFVVTAQKNQEYEKQAIEVYKECMKRKSWGFNKNTKNVKHLKKGDKVLFYVGAPTKSFVGTAILGEYEEITNRVSLGFIDNWNKQIKVEDILHEIDFIKNKKSWYTHFIGSIKKINAEDFEKIVKYKDYDWVKEFKRKLSNKKRTISYNSSNSFNKRIDGYIGGETTYRGFRTAILYLQLKPNIDVNIIKKVTRILGGFVDRPNTKIGSYATLFLNNEEGKLIYPKSIIENKDSASRLIKEYYDKFCSINLRYSSELNQLFPPTGMYCRKRYPSKEDICILITDENDFSINKNIIEKLKKLKNNWIWIMCEKGKSIKVYDWNDEIFKKLLDNDFSINEDRKDISEFNLELPEVKLPNDIYIYLSTEEMFFTGEDNYFEIFSDGKGRKGDTSMSFNKKYDYFKLDKQELCRLWGELKRANIFSLKSKYKNNDRYSDGTCFDLKVRGEGKSLELMGNAVNLKEFSKIEGIISKYANRAKKINRR